MERPLLSVGRAFSFGRFTTVQQVHYAVERGLFADVQALLIAPTLAEMAATVSDEPIEVAVPDNLITDDGAGRARGRADDFELLL